MEPVAPPQPGLAHRWGGECESLVRAEPPMLGAGAGSTGHTGTQLKQNACCRKGESTEMAEAVRNFLNTFIPSKKLLL